MDINDNWDYLNYEIKTEKGQVDEENSEQYEPAEVKVEVKEEIETEEDDECSEENGNEEEEEEPLLNLIDDKEDNLPINDPLAIPDDYQKPSSSSSSKLIIRDNLMCPKCNKVFAYPKHLQTHLANHANYEFPCADCNKMFYKPYNLKRHLDVCPAKKKYNDGHLFAVMCKLCGKGFKKQSLLKEHLAAIHLIGERRKFECEKCGKCFTQKKNLKYHQTVSQNCSFKKLKIIS